jgi:nucleotide-binding universal stress UspA family protein
MAEPRPRPGRLEGRPLSPRAFRPFGVEALVVGAPTLQEGLVRREGVAIWRRLPEHAPVFDRLAATTELGPEGTGEPQGGAPVGPEGSGEPQGGAPVGPDGLLPVRVVVAVTPARDRAMRVPATGERAARVLAAAEAPVPDTAGWVLLVDEGPGETWLYLAEERDPGAVLAGFLGRRGRTDFDRARRRSRLGSLGSVGLLLGLVLAIYGGAMGLGAAGQAIGGTVVAASLLTLVRARPR